jgi:hypothetical protein
MPKQLGPQPKPFRRIRGSNLKKLAKIEKQRFTQPKLEVESGRSGHVNLIVNISKPGVYKNLPKFKEKNRDGLPIVQEIDFEAEFDREEERNYDITNVKLVKLKYGKHKGKEVEKTVVNNPSGVRYKMRAWK